jgi:hypothetical protein
MIERGNFILPPPAASQYLDETWGIRRRPATLAKLRCTSSEGPKYVKAGREVRYSPNTLDDFARSLISEPRTSTSDVAAQAA